MGKEGIKVKFIINTDFNLCRTVFEEKVKKTVEKLSEDYIVISYKMKENEFHQISGAFIRYKNKKQ